jgi:tRNA-dihydrouridine synthase B
MEYTGAAGVMIGRAAQGKPWLPGMIARALTEQPLNPPALNEQCVIIKRHLSALHDF